MKGTETIKIEQPFEGDGNRIYYVNGGRCSGKVNKTINELVDYINNLQQENRKQKEVIDEAISIINEHFKYHPELFTENQREYDLIRKIEHILKGKQDMNFDKEILMMNEDEARKRARELLNENQVDLITKYMFLEQKLQRQKEVIDKAIKYINDNLIISSILDGKKYYTINNYSFNYRELLDILKEVE